MIDSETGLPYDWSNPGGGAASTQPAYGQIPGAGAAASTQPAYGVIPPGINPQLPAGLSGTAIGQQPGGGGMSPLGGGVASTQPAYGVIPPQNRGLSPLLMALIGGGQGGGQGGGIHPLLQYLMGMQQQPQGPPPDPLTPQQRAFMGYGGAGQPPNWAAAMGMPDPTGGWSPQYQPQTPQQASTPQDFVSQWRQMFGST